MRCIALAACLAAAPACSRAAGQDVYVANQLANTVSVFELAVPTNTTTLPVGAQPHEIAMHPSGRWIFVSNRLDGTVSVLDGATRSELDVDGDPTNGLTRIPTGTLPHGLAVSPDGALLAVTNNGTGDVTLCSATTFQVLATVPGVGASPHMTRFTPDGLQLWVVNLLGGDVRIIDVPLALASPALAAGAAIPLGGTPEGIAFTPGGATAFVAGAAGNNLLHVIDVATHAVSSIPVGNHTLRVEVTEDGNEAWTSSILDGTLHVVDAQTGAVTGVVAGLLGPVGLGFSPEGDRVLVAGFPGTTYEVDRVTRAVIATHAAGAGSDGLIVQPALLSAVTAPAPGGTGTILLRRPQDAGLPYRAACSLATTPGLVIGSRVLALAPDALFFLSLAPQPFFTGFQGSLDALGGASLQITLPALPQLSGLSFFLAAVTFSAQAPQGIATVTPSLGLVVQ